MFHTRVHLLYWFSSASLLACFTYIPILMDELGLGKEHVTVVVAVYSFCAFVSSSLAGRGSDRFGRRLFLQVGLILSTLTFSLQFFMNDYNTVIFTRILTGISAGIYPPAMIAYAYENRIMMGKFSSIGSLGWAIGNFIAGIIASFSTRFVFVMTGIFFFTAFLIALRLPETENPEKSSETNNDIVPVSTIIKNNMPVYASVFFRHSAAFAIWTLWPLFLKDMGFDNFQIGVVQSANAMTQFVVMYFLTDRLKSESLIPIGLLLSCFTFITFLMTENFYLFLITQVFLGISWAALYVGSVKYITENNPFNERGTASGFLTSTLSVSGLIGPFYAFTFLQLFQEEAVFHLIVVFAAVMSILGLISFYLLQNLPKRDLSFVEC